jgi:hypothetical protein
MLPEERYHAGQQVLHQYQFHNGPPCVPFDRQNPVASDYFSQCDFYFAYNHQVLVLRIQHSTPEEVMMYFAEHPDGEQWGRGQRDC